MKKFYALAAALLATGSMLASSPHSAVGNMPTEAEISKEGLAMLRAEQAYNQYAADYEIARPGSQKYTWTDNTGTKWTLTMMESGQWSDNFTTWAGVRFYSKFSVTLQNDYTSTADRKTINYMMFYPHYNCIKEEYRSQYFPEVQLSDSLKPIALKYWDAEGERSIKSIWGGFCVPGLSSSGANSFYIGQTEDNGTDYFIIMNTNTPNSSNQPYFTTSSMGYCMYNGVRCGANQGSKLVLSNFDDDTASINASFSGTANNTAGTNIWTYSYDYSGEANMFGLTSKKESWTPTSVHIVNTGDVDGESEGYEAIDDTDWGPLRRFYLLACGEGYTYDQVELAGGGNLWSATTIPSGPARTANNAPNLAQARGALFSAKGAEEPNSIWYAADITVGFDNLGLGITEGMPSVNCFLYGGWREDFWPWSQESGFKQTYEGYYWYYPYAANDKDKGTYTPFIMNGTTDGLGMLGITTFNCPMMVNYKGDIVYHYDANNYLNTRKIASVGTITPPEAWSGVKNITTDGENNINVVAADGMINVTVDNAAVVGIYNMAGMIVKSVNAKAGETVNVNVANGIYIVKVGNKAVKVAL